MRKLLFIIICFVFFFFTSNAQVIILEAEQAILSGDVISTSYNSTACVYMKTDGSITFNANVNSTGFYKLTIRAATPSGNKNQDLYVNNEYNALLQFPANNNWFDFNAGTILLKQGNNTIRIQKNWGWIYFDKIILEPTPPNDYSKIDENLINPNSDDKTKNVYAFLRSQYGQNIISGQTAYWDELIAVAERTPVIRAFDFQSYTVGYPYLWDNTIGGHTFGWIDSGVTQDAINWYNSTDKKGIVSFQWHWHSPWGGNVSTNTFYTQYTNFDVSQAVVQGTNENTAIIRDIDSIASQLKRLQNAGVPVLWRPLHEAGGKWFWWGAKTANDCLKLYDILYERLTNYHQLNNLIWVWATPEEEWYPGNNKIDIIGYDSYPGAYVYGTQKAVFNQLYDIVGGEKMIAMTENGPLPDIDKCIEEDAMWLYFSSWSNLVTQQNSNEHIKQVYAHKNVITLDEMLDIITKVKTTQTNDFFIYPNPAKNELTVEGIKRKGNSTITITNTLGQVVLNTQYVDNGNVMRVNIEQLFQGIYFINIGNQVQKFVKQ